MGDDNQPSTVDSSSANLSEAEKLRLRRRQRILENQGARLQRILKNESSTTTNSTFNQRGETEKSPTGFDEDSVDFIGSSSSTSYGEIFGVKDHKVSDIRTSAPQTLPVQSKPKRKSSDPNSPSTPNLESILKELSSDPDLASLNLNAAVKEEEEEVTRIGVQSDGTVILPRLSYRFGRILLCLLAIFLSVFKAKQFFVTFISWEIAFYFMNGLPPVPPPNMVMVLAAVMGIRDVQLQRIKKVLHLINCIMADFSLFISFVLLPHIVSSFLKT